VRAVCVCCAGATELVNSTQSSQRRYTVATLSPRGQNNVKTEQNGILHRNHWTKRQTIVLPLSIREFKCNLPPNSKAESTEQTQLSLSRLLLCWMHLEIYAWTLNYPDRRATNGPNLVYKPVYCTDADTTPNSVQP